VALALSGGLGDLPPYDRGSNQGSGCITEEEQAPPAGDQERPLAETVKPASDERLGYDDDPRIDREESTDCERVGFHLAR
jgi:hypothetical protein